MCLKIFESIKNAPNSGAFFIYVRFFVFGMLVLLNKSAKNGTKNNRIMEQV